MNYNAFDELEKYEFNLMATSNAPGLPFSVYDMLRPSIDSYGVVSKDQYTDQERHQFDKTFMDAVKSGEVPKLKLLDVNEIGLGIYVVDGGQSSSNYN